MVLTGEDGSTGTDICHSATLCTTHYVNKAQSTHPSTRQQPVMFYRQINPAVRITEAPTYTVWPKYGVVQIVTAVLYRVHVSCRGREGGCIPVTCAQWKELVTVSSCNWSR